jgi:hypothetical protein
LKKVLPPPEAVIWMVALALLAIYDPHPDTHFTLCPLANAGFDFCPGCGLGRAVSYAFHGEWRQSWDTHPLGIFAVIILTYRIITLLLKHYTPYGKSY